MEDLAALDMKGRTVHIGDLVRIVDLDMDLFDYLEPREVEDIRSMIGESFPVEEISTTGLVTVTKWFTRGPGQTESHTLSLLQGQFELAD